MVESSLASATAVDVEARVAIGEFEEVGGRVR